MLTTGFTLLVFAFASLTNVVLTQHTPVRRDDNLPARVPYIFPTPGTDAVADAIRARRENGTLLDLDGVLLQDEPLAAGWNDLFGAIRDNNTLPATMRELFILRTGTLNKAAYVWLQHEPVGRSAGLTLPQLREIRLTHAFASEHTPKSSLTPELKAAMLFADFMTKSVQVPQPVFDGLHKFLDDKQMVDAVATVGGYNFVTRLVVALNVDGKMDVVVPIPSQ
ncbi:4-carboxymuconolactone decarboxylase [Polyporus arcularius HHB13444]|uniref:4-carboxymuconolactone decarboxylase n=1 Tax=Polyporus arcularius HHB13444 TaxID=1314778 RepID=A0A5C3PL43_9APHY|nr:4-carboxymuconolactone decarboxylase [Polyporus arcularius HHB13444]